MSVVDARVSFMNKPDGALQALVDAINFVPGNAVGVTITVQGTVITGILISDGEYATNIAAVFRKIHNFTSPEQKGYDVLFDQLAAQAEERRTQHEAARAADDPEADVEPTEFLHLRDAYTLTGDHLPGGEGAWWRVRLADVSAWTFTMIGRG